MYNSRDMSPRSYIIATAGHVDHGKSALVKALTGTDPDRLPEEKARGITIDLGFAHLPLDSAAAKGGGTFAMRLAIVDVPGHEDFVKNMVAGVGSVDLALLVVAADDGWMPQTEEHFQILTYLGVRRAVVALTKVDLVEDDQRVRAQIHEKLRGTSLADAPIIATSIVAGSGIVDLKLELARALEDVAPQQDIGKPRLAVDRVFSLKGIGTVVTGTLIGGTLRRGQSVVVQPAGRPARIRTIQTHGHEVELAQPGTRVALNLPDLAVGQRSTEAGTKARVSRGDVITVSELGAPSDTFDVVVERSQRSSAAPGTAESGEGKPIPDGARVRVHFGSSNVPARLYLHSVAELAPGGSAYAQLRFESPAFILPGDRFILRDWPERYTLAGGRVLDAQAPRAGFRAQARQQYLAQLDRVKDPIDQIQTILGRTPFVNRSSLLLRSPFSRDEVQQALAQLAARHKIVMAGDIVADPDAWRGLKEVAARSIDAEHAAHPDRAGLSINDLRAALDGQAIAKIDCFDALVSDLCADGFDRVGPAIRRRSHRPALPPHLQAAGAKVRAALAAKPYDPPSRKELAPDSVSFQALKFLLNTGEAVDISADLVFLSDQYARAVDAIRAYLKQHGAATVSDLKQTLSASRRVMVPLLEKLDRDGVTMRQGDKRVLRVR
jgi:selenocysteine-specific elongation factor